MKLCSTILKVTGPYFFLKHLPFLQLTEVNDEMRQRAMSGLFGAQYSTPNDHHKGYSPPPADTIGFGFKPLSGEKALINEKGIGYLKRTIELCKAKNIPLMLILPPAYKSLELELNPDFYPTAKRICEEGGVVIKDYRDMAIKEDHRFFRDQTHLNKAGAEIFSKLVADDIKLLLQKNQNIAVNTSIKSN